MLASWESPLALLSRLSSICATCACIAWRCLYLITERGTVTCLHGLNPLAGLNNISLVFLLDISFWKSTCLGELWQSGPDRAGPSLTERKTWCPSLREGWEVLLLDWVAYVLSSTHNILQKCYYILAFPLIFPMAWQNLYKVSNIPYVSMLHTLVCYPGKEACIDQIDFAESWAWLSDGSCSACRM